MKNSNKLSLAAMFLALGIVLPFFTGQIPRLGKMLLPMHLPVMLCGFVCGEKYGLVVGAALPLVRSALLGTPLMFPDAAAMCPELMTYGFVSGFLYRKIKPRKGKLLLCLCVAMLSGRAVWGVARAIFVGMGGGTFTWKIFVAQGFVNSLPGTALQLILIPPLIKALQKNEFFPREK